jgi:hypothetical protein
MIPNTQLPAVNVGTTSGDHTGDGSAPGTGQVPFQKVNNAITQLNAITAALTATNSGWGTPTGAGVVVNFSGSAATLSQCSAAIAQILTILKSIGTIQS